MPEFSYKTRKEEISSLSGKRVSCLIIGGGIVGAGLANILAENGISTVLVEKGDFASGTSSNSSKLIHGGIRYLAQGHFKLTMDLLRERNYLISNTDIVRRMDFDILIDRYSWSPSYMRLGLFLYSILGGEPGIPRMHRNKGEYDRSVRGYFSYFDGATDDSTLVLYNVISAHNRGAVCLNYSEAVSLSDLDGGVSARILDRTDGEEISFTADVVVNCTGPWINSVLRLYQPGTSVPLKLSKGVHLIFDRRVIPVDRAVTFRSHIDRRQMFIIPRESVVIVGTTESLVDGPEDLEIRDDEIGYIVRSAARLFPGLASSDVIGKYSGIRPLLGKGNNPDRISRDFSIFAHGRMVSVAGVKITDFRHASRKIAKKVASMCGVGIRTRDLPSIDYRRVWEGDRFKNYILQECAMFPEDITRRREGTSIYDPKNIRHVSEAARKAFVDLGAVNEIWVKKEA